MLKKFSSKRIFFFIASLMLCVFMCAASPALADNNAILDEKIAASQKALDDQKKALEDAKAANKDEASIKALEEKIAKEQENLDKYNEIKDKNSSSDDEEDTANHQYVKFDELFKCPGWGEMTSFYEKCDLCKVMLKFFDGASFMTQSIANALESPMTKLLSVMLALWIAFKTLVFFSTPASELDGGQYLTEVGKMLVKGAFGAGFIAGGCTFVFEWMLAPFMDSVANLVAAVSDAALRGSSGSGGPAFSGVQALTDAGTRDMLDGMLFGIMKPFAQMKSVGLGLMCNGFTGIRIPSDEIIDNLSFLSLFQIKFPSPLMIVFGALIWLTFAWTCFIYALTFMDIIMRFCLFLGFIPIVTVAWVFPATKKYADNCWRVFLNTALTFICTAIFLSMIIQIIESVLGAEFMGYAMSSNFVDAYLSLSLVKGLWIVEHFAINPMPFLLVIVVGIVAWKGVAIPNEVAGKLSKIGFEGIESCGVKAAKNIINAIFDIIMLIITIITFGATSFVQAIEPVQKSEKAIEQAKKFQEHLERLKKARRRMAKAKKAFNKATS